MKAQYLLNFRGFSNRK